MTSTNRILVVMCRENGGFGFIARVKRKKLSMKNDPNPKVWTVTEGMKGWGVSQSLSPTKMNMANILSIAFGWEWA